ncbi:four-helix bundle copper-binding protein [Bacillus sp. JJ1609]|uniref:four-helix bundle copper-binding protein n=1 Tax=Bacillus sp. JJ1609 TaxID=3122977 RepID=UPI002FFD6654
MEACNVCFDSCLKEENVKMMAECIRLDRECAEICGLAVTAMQTNSHFVKQICGLCSEICETCGNECKQHDHEHCQRCADTCFKCAEACRNMVS